MLPGRRFVSALRARLGGGSGPGVVGQSWSPAVAAVWPELEEQIDAHLRRPGTAAVSTWEVCAAELARCVVGEEGEGRRVERFSDGLAPTLDALQAPHKALPGALREGREAGERAGTLAAATRPLVLLPHGLGPSLAEGWGKTVVFVGPVAEGARDPERARAVLLAVGPRLEAACAEAEARLREALSRLPAATDPMAGLVSPFEQWADVLTRALEVEIYGGAKGFIGALRP